MIEQHVGQLDISGGVPGGEIRVNGEAMGTLPLTEPIRVLVGTAELEVTSPGYEPVSRRIEILAGTLTRETIRMLPHVNTESINVVLRADRDTHRTTLPDPTWRAIGYAAIGIGAGAVVTGIVVNILRENRALFYNQNCPGNGDDRSFDGCLDARSSAEAETAVAVTTYVIGGILAASGLAILAAAPSRRVTTSVASSSSSCSGGPGMIGVHCGFRF